MQDLANKGGFGYHLRQSKIERNRAEPLPFAQQASHAFQAQQLMDQPLFALRRRQRFQLQPHDTLE